MVKLVDTRDLKSLGLWLCRFKPGSGYQRKTGGYRNTTASFAGFLYHQRITTCITTQGRHERRPRTTGKTLFLCVRGHPRYRNPTRARNGEGVRGPVGGIHPESRRLSEKRRRTDFNRRAS